MTMRKHFALVLAFAVSLGGQPVGAEERTPLSDHRNTAPSATPSRTLSHRHIPAKSMLLRALEATMEQKAKDTWPAFQSPAVLRPMSSMLSRTTAVTRPEGPRNRSVLTTSDAAPMAQRRRTRQRPTQAVTTNCSQAIMNQAETDADDRGVGAYIGGGFLLPVIMPLIADSMGPERPTTRLLQGISPADETCYSDYYGERVKARKVNAAWKGTWIGFGLLAGLVVLAVATGPSY